MSSKQSVEKKELRKGPWSKEEDDKLRAYIERYGHWNWREIPRFAGVSRCGKSCRLRWMNYLRPNMKHGNFTTEEENLIIKLHNKIGNKWATIALELPGRSDNEIKNYWNTHLRKHSKQNQNFSKNMNDKTLESNEAGPIKDLAKNPKNEDEIEALWASLSSEMSYANNTYESLSSCIELTSPMFSGSDSLVSGGDSIQTYDNDYDGNFWTDPFQTDSDVTSSTKFSTDTNVFNSLMGSSASSHEMKMSDEFLWSTMDLYSEVNHFMC